jgi:hypothetical protein
MGSPNFNLISYGAVLQNFEQFDLPYRFGYHDERKL